MISPTQRSLAHLRRRGALCAVVERWNSYAKIRQDLFGFGDIIAAHPDHPPLIIQACRSDDQATRLAKIRSAKVWPKARRWLEGGGRIEVWSWAVRVHPDKRRRWTLKVEPVRLEEE